MNLDFLISEHPLHKALLDPGVVLAGSKVSEPRRVVVLALMSGRDKAEAMALAGYKAAPQYAVIEARRLMRRPEVALYRKALEAALLRLWVEDYKQHTDDPAALDRAIEEFEMNVIGAL